MLLEVSGRVSHGAPVLYSSKEPQINRYYSYTVARANPQLESVGSFGVSGPSQPLPPTGSSWPNPGFKILPPHDLTTSRASAVAPHFLLRKLRFGLAES